MGGLHPDAFMRRADVVAVLAVLLLLAGCGFVSQPIPQPTESPPFPPMIDIVDPEYGVRYDYTFLTHCGLRGAVIDGELWLPVGGTRARTTHNFDFNWDQGSIVFTDADDAVYTSSMGVDVPLAKWTGPWPSFAPCF